MGKKIDRLVVGKTYRLVDKDGYFNSHPRNYSIAEIYMPNRVITITEDLLHDTIDIISPQELEFFELVEDNITVEQLLALCTERTKELWEVVDEVSMVCTPEQLENYRKRIFEDFGVDCTADQHTIFGGVYSTLQDTVEGQKSPVEDEPYLWDGKEELQVGMKLTSVNACGTELTLERINRAGKGYDTQYIVSEVNYKKIHILYYEDLRTLIPDPKREFTKKMLAKVRGSHLDFAHDNTWDIVELAGMCFDELKGGNCSG